MPGAKANGITQYLIVAIMRSLSTDLLSGSLPSCFIVARCDYFFSHPLTDARFTNLLISISVVQRRTADLFVWPMNAARRNVWVEPRTHSDGYVVQTKRMVVPEGDDRHTLAVAAVQRCNTRSTIRRRCASLTRTH